ncbi:MAG TPA: hypothetical protein VMU50_21915 [Polyangia bacterium]|nr:hypothetical protein [Polyangia bacterium]
MKFARALILASLFAAAACTGSEETTQPGSGGHHGGSGGAAGSGMTTTGGSGGTSETSGGSGGISDGSGGSGTGGARADAGGDATGTGSGGSGDDAGDGLYHYEVDIAYVLRQDCGGCHLQPTVQGGFDMKIVSDLMPGPDAYPTIMGTVTAAHAGCPRLDATKKRIVPNKPENSLLYIKISTQNPPGACGGHMPMGTNMPQQHIDKIKTWITQGALR